MGKLSKIVYVSVTTLLVSIGAVTYLALWTGSTRDIEVVANKFQPGSSWTLVSEKVTPPRLLCLDGSCPSLQQKWQINNTLSREQFVATLPVEFSVKLSGQCQKVSNKQPSSMLNCYAFGKFEGYKVNISYEKHTSNTSQVILNIIEE